jgi:hypothetical protein
VFFRGFQLMLRTGLAPRLRPRLALCGLFAVAALTLAACGGSSTTTVSTAGSPATTATTSTTPATGSTATGSTTTSTGPPTTSDLRQAFDAALRKNLTQNQGLTSQQADCVLNELQKTLPDSQVQATISGQTPKAVTDAAFKAGLKCANQ